MKTRASTITLLIGGLGLAGLRAFRSDSNETLFQIIGLAIVVLSAIVLVWIMVASNIKRLSQMKIVAEQTGFTLLSKRTQMMGDTPPGLFGISLGSDKWPDSADFTKYFPEFLTGIKRSAGPAVHGTDSNGTTWFILQYEYTTSPYRGVSQNFAIVLAKPNLNFPYVSMLSSYDLGRPTLAGKVNSPASTHISIDSANRFDVKYSYLPAASELLTPDLIEVMKGLPLYDYAFSGPYVMACLCDENRANILLSMKASIERILATMPHRGSQDAKKPGS